MYGISPLALRKELSQWSREYGDKLFQRAIRNDNWAFSLDEDAWDRHRCSMNFY